MPRVLVVTNDFPPRPGGIQTFVHRLASHLPPDDVVVFTSTWKGSQAFDAAQPFCVERIRGSVMLPTPAVTYRAKELAKAHECTAVWFGAAAPLGLMGAALRRGTPVQRVVASTHGHEVGWAMLPGSRQVLRRIGRRVDVVTYLGEYTRSRLEPAFGSHPEFARLPSGVDTDLFHPGHPGRDEIRQRHGLGDRPVVVCVSRLVPRKGQDVLIRALPAIRARVPEAALLIVGGGPHRSKLAELAREHGVESAVAITGSVPWGELSAYYAAGDAFAMPCRDRLGGLEVEGLGIVFLEASATGLPVVAGRSGGSPDAVLEGETGYLVDGRSVTEVAEAVAGLLEQPERAAAMGAAGRAWVERAWRWDVLAARLQELLTG